MCAVALVSGAGVAKAVTPIKTDLDFILAQVKRAEAHAAGGQLLGTGPNQISNPLLPFGLRTVDGTFNNLIPGQELFGAADRVFPRLLDPLFRPAEAWDPDGPGPAPATPTSYAQKKGIVADSRPRIISNLIVDQTTGNPAAAAAAADTPGSEETGGQFFIPNQAPDAGLSAPFNSWFIFFGQFFDHGLDLTNKGGSGTVMVPLQPDDPLYVPGSRTNFMVLTRATNRPGPDGRVGDNPATPAVDESADDVQEHTNQTTPFVDQNQTYTSHPSHQVFLREYELNGSGNPVSTGRMLDRPSVGGLATWADVKAQAQSMLGIALDDQDLLNLPLLVTDPYGKFIPNPSTGFAQIVTSASPQTVASGTPGAPVDATAAIRTGHAFLDDIAHHAVPFGDHDNNPATPRQPLAPDAAPGTADDNDPATYDDELLDAHFITGDGRGNENIGLTTVHHVFHAEHNRLVGEIKSLILAQDAAFIAEWQLAPGVWNGERLFQAARFFTEMEYQHLVFEEFARKVQPQVNVFAGYHTEIDPAIVAEFAHTVYRFGHSMLTETVARKEADGTNNDIGLIEAFLNPLEFTDNGRLTPQAAAGSIVQGTTGKVGNEIDEFVTGALRNNLVGLPLDLATINLARGRDTGVPPLNAARREFFAETSHPALQPYESWTDFKLGIRHPESLVNFVAAYGAHPTITAATTVADKRAAATLLVNGGAGAPTDRLAFLNSTGTWASGTNGVTTTGVDSVDFWIGGLAEKQMPFGGMLGSSFNFVFETQMEKLQDGDRLYYLSRTAALNFLTQLEENSFAELIMRNTTANHLPFDVFSTPNYTFELANLGPGDPVDDPKTPYDESQLLLRMPNGTLRFPGEEHIVMGGTGGVDRMQAGDGDDTLWGDGDDDRLEGGAGNDALVGGAGHDILTDVFGDDNIKGGVGNDAINAGSGFDLILGGFGEDFIVGGADPKEIFAGGGDDFVAAGDSSDEIFANEGDDWIEGGAQADLMQGDNGDPFQLGRFGNDVVIGDGGNDDMDSEGGDDIMVTGPGIERHEGMIGFDWVTHRGDPQAANDDMNVTGLLPPEGDLRERWDLVEGLSGWNHDDVLRGDEADATTMVDQELTNIGLIDGLAGLLGTGVTQFNGGNIVLGGAGSDILEGRAGDDLIDGDSWLNVRISVRAANDPSTEIRSVDSMSAIQADVLAGIINPAQLRVVREIKTATPGPADIDTAVFSDLRASYDINRSTANPAQATVRHIGGTLNDGTDTLKNVERLTFSDQTIELDSIPTNTPATGTVNISDTTPTEDQTLTATKAFTDLDGVNDATIVYSWQTETDVDVWATIGTGVTFAPSDVAVGLRMRVVATFEDGDGVLESITSAPTAAVINVNDPPTGAPQINDATPAVDEPLRASTNSIEDLDGLAGVSFAYQWQEQVGTAAFTNIAGASGESFTPTDAQVGKRLRVVVSFTDNHGTAEQLISSATGVVTRPDSTPPAVPAPPDLVDGSDSGASKTDNVTKVTTPTFKGSTEAFASVQLFVDGEPHGGAWATNSTGAYSIKTGALSEGVHLVAARATDLAGNTSALSEALSVTIDTTLPTASPLVLSSPRFSPNGDGKADTLPATSTLSEAATWQLEVLPVNLSRVIFAQTGSGTAVAGSWDGRENGTVVADGEYRLRLRAQDVAGNALKPFARAIWVDTAAPVLSGLSAVPNPFNPALEPVAVSVGVNEASTVYARITKAGVLVRVLPSVKLTAAGSAAFTWDGRDAAGNLVAAGTYRAIVTGTDLAKNSTVQGINFTASG